MKIAYFESGDWCYLEDAPTDRDYTIFDLPDDYSEEQVEEFVRVQDERFNAFFERIFTIIANQK